MTKNLKMAVLAAAVLAIPAFGVSTACIAQPARPAAAAPALPEAIKRAAIATRSTRGSIAGARIGNSNHFVVYINARSGCGSGGCRAQIWAVEGGRPVRKESIVVGKLPIVQLPAVDNGLPRIGVTTTTPDNRLAVLPIAYDGQNYTGEMYGNLLAPGSGRPLITPGMLRPY